MTPQTITQLNRLNQAFYTTVAPHFHESRQQPWKGWTQLGPYLQDLPATRPVRVLDVGAGNNRFLHFLVEALPSHSFQYLAVDSNRELQEYAWHKNLRGNSERSQMVIDVVHKLADDTFLQSFESSPFGQEFDLIVAFGFLHHVPSLVLRQRLLSQCAQLLAPNGLMIMTAWQFLDNATQQKKLVDPSIVGINPQELEPNDYLLSWNRGVTAYRYCHFIDEHEITQLTPANVRTLTTFDADGRSDTLNRYLVWQKSEE